MIQRIPTRLRSETHRCRIEDVRERGDLRSREKNDAGQIKRRSRRAVLRCVACPSACPSALSFGTVPKKANLDFALPRTAGEVGESDPSRNMAQSAQWDKLVTRNASPVTRDASNLGFRVTDAKHVLEAVCVSR